MEQETVCAHCGIVAENGAERRRIDRESSRDHDWSWDDPLARAEARIESSAVEAGVEKQYNDGWWVLTVELSDHDHVAASEVVADAAHKEGLRFIGVNENTEELRFNKKRGGD